MTVQEFMKNKDMDEQLLFARKIQNWLKPYSQRIYEQVMVKMEKIVNDERVLKLIDELYEREEKERVEETETIRFAMATMDNLSFYKFELHSHPLEHSKAYRAVLDDMFIDD